MSNVIMEIIRIEGKAKEISEVANKEKEKLPQRLKEFYKEADTQVGKEAAAKIDQITGNMKQQTDEKLKEIYAERESRVSLIEKQFKDKKEALVIEVFNRIVGRC